MWYWWISDAYRFYLIAWPHLDWPHFVICPHLIVTCTSLFTHWSILWAHLPSFKLHSNLQQLPSQPFTVHSLQSGSLKQGCNTNMDKLTHWRLVDLSSSSLYSQCIFTYLSHQLLYLLRLLSNISCSEAPEAQLGNMAVIEGHLQELQEEHYQLRNDKTPFKQSAMYCLYQNRQLFPPHITLTFGHSRHTSRIKLKVDSLEYCHGAKPTSDRLLTQLHWVWLCLAKVGVRQIWSRSLAMVS
jgi:hypothetical protein